MPNLQLVLKEVRAPSLAAKKRSLVALSEGSYSSLCSKLENPTKTS